MKWINHIVVTGTLVYLATLDPLSAVSSMAGSVLPDKIEGRPPKEKKAYWQWRKKHRTITHWPVIYLFPMAIILLILHKQYLPTEYTFPLHLGVFVLLGAFLHILEDAVCGKVPLLSRKKKIGLHLFRVTSVGEYIFVVGLLIVAILARIYIGF